MKTYGYDNRLVIITEDANGIPYCLESDYIMDVIEDYQHDGVFMPANDARVFLAIWNDKPINPHLYTDFASLLVLLEAMIH